MIPKNIQSDKMFVKKSVKVQASHFGYLDEDFKEDKKLFLKFFKKNPYIARFVTKR